MPTVYAVDVQPGRAESNMSKQNVCADTDSVHKYGKMCRAEGVRADLLIGLRWRNAESGPALFLWTCRCPAVMVIPTLLSGDESEAEGQRVLSV